MGTIQKINRRDFVKLFGLTSTGIILGCNISSDKKEFIPTSDENSFSPNVFIQIQKNGNITLMASRSEMGQGIRTSLASAIADEMEADWKYITVKQAIGHEKYGNQNRILLGKVEESEIPMNFRTTERTIEKKNINVLSLFSGKDALFHSHFFNLKFHQ